MSVKWKGLIHHEEVLTSETHAQTRKHKQKTNDEFRKGE